MTSEGKDKARADRLTAALRDNLKRRKAQGRSQVAAGEPTADTAPDGKAS